MPSGQPDNVDALALCAIMEEVALNEQLAAMVVDQICDALASPELSTLSGPACYLPPEPRMITAAKVSLYWGNWGIEKTPKGKD